MEVPVSTSMGVMRSLPGMLELLLSDPGGNGLQKGEKNKIRTLKCDLEELTKYLVEPSEVEAPALTASSWMKEVRELSYDIHDFVDELVDVDLHAEIQRPRRPRFPRFQEKLKRHQIDDEISRFRARVKEAIQLYNDHLVNLKRWPSISSAASSDGRLLPRHKMGSRLPLVGLASSIDELSGCLANDGKPERIVACIVGPGGAGKTILANELYSKLAGQFQCRAFVRTSRKPNPRRLLSSILSQVRRQQPLDAFGVVPNLVNEIKEYLRDKTYFIIIDELWDPSTWDIVNQALPMGDYCSRILITTEVDVVARTCSAGNSNYIFKKPLLSNAESRELYSNVVSTHRSDQCPHKHLNEVPDEIIKEIGGLPLAIIIMANILARQPARIDQYIKNYSSSLFTRIANLDGIKQVLNFSYNSLPHYLKACMLYLSLYEEDSIIYKVDLVKQWISEGFICAMEGEELEEIAHMYFNELVDRGMIQPVDISSNDEVLSCTVHYKVLDIIRDKSIEENFIIAIDHSQTAARLGDKIRRLALNYGNAEDAKTPTNMRLSQVRSLSFSGFIKCMPSVVEFRILRVLILKLLVDPDGKSHCNLTGISGLFRLKYLHIDACHVRVELPAQMKGLRELVALEIEANVTAVPADIVDIPGLLYLSLPSETHLPTGIGRMTSVHTLGCFNLTSNSEYNVINLGKLSNLQDLHLTCSTVESNNLKNRMQILGSILSMLTKLKSVTLVPSRFSRVNTMNGVSIPNTEVSPSPDFFQRLEISRRCCIFDSLPKWIGKLSKLCILKIAVRGLATSDFDVIKGLPSLTVLSLYIHTLPEERIVFTKEGFSALKYFKFRSNALRVNFEEDAMPNLQRLKLCFNAPRLDESGTAHISIEHLSSLKEISAKIGGTGADSGSVTDFTKTTAISSHSRNPRITVQTVDYILYQDASVNIEENKPKLEDEKTQGTSRNSLLIPESSTNQPVPELMKMKQSTVEDATTLLEQDRIVTVEDAMVSGSKGIKGFTVLAVKIDLECAICYKKINKVLRKLQDKENIKTIYFDFKYKNVIISGPFNLKKLRDRLKCMAGSMIKEFEVKQLDELINAIEPKTRPQTKKPGELIEDFEISKQNIRNHTELQPDEDDIQIVETNAPQQTGQREELTIDEIEIVESSMKANEQTMQPDVKSVRTETADQRYKDVCPICHSWPCSELISHRSQGKQIRGSYWSRRQPCSQRQQSAWMSYHVTGDSLQRRKLKQSSLKADLRSFFLHCNHAPPLPSAPFHCFHVNACHPRLLLTTPTRTPLSVSPHKLTASPGRSGRGTGSRIVEGRHFLKLWYVGGIPLWNDESRPQQCTTTPPSSPVDPSYYY